MSQLTPQSNAPDARQEIVYAGGAEVRRDVTATMDRVTWSHEDPAGTTVQEGGFTSFGGPDATFYNPVVQLDPVGASVGWADPAQFEEPPPPPDETSPEGRVYNNPWRPWQGCAIQWLPMPCELVLGEIGWHANGVASFTVRSDVETLRITSKVGYWELGGDGGGDTSGVVKTNTYALPIYYTSTYRRLTETVSFSGYMQNGYTTREAPLPQKDYLEVNRDDLRSRLQAMLKRNPDCAGWFERLLREAGNLSGEEPAYTSPVDILDHVQIRLGGIRLDGVINGTEYHKIYNLVGGNISDGTGVVHLVPYVFQTPRYALGIELGNESYAMVFWHESGHIASPRGYAESQLGRAAFNIATAEEKAQYPYTASADPFKDGYYNEALRRHCLEPAASNPK